VKGVGFGMGRFIGRQEGLIDWGEGCGCLGVWVGVGYGWAV